MYGKSRVSSAIKYDCFKLDDSGNCIIRMRWLHCIRFEKKLMKSFRIAREALIAVLVCSILMNTMLMKILQ